MRSTFLNLVATFSLIALNGTFAIAASTDDLEWIRLQQQVFDSVRSGAAIDKQYQPNEMDNRKFQAMQPWLSADAHARLAEFSQPLRSAHVLLGSKSCELAPVSTIAQLQNGVVFAETADTDPRWFELALPLNERWTLEAFAANDDATLSAFASCKGELLKHSDDAVLLQPRLTLSAESAAVVWIKLERKIGKATQVRALQTGQISGNITAPATFPNGAVSAYNASGMLIANSSVVNNRYELELPPGNYYIKSAYQRTVSQVYNNVECAPKGVRNCNLSAATLLPLALNQQLTDINFLMDGGASIAGRVYDEETGIGIAAGVSTEGGTNFSQADAGGRFVLRQIAAGDILITSVFDNSGSALPARYLAQRYRNQNCLSESFQSCTQTLADPVTVSRGSTQLGIDFPLRRISTISGTVSAGSSALIEVIDSAGAVVAGSNGFGPYVVSDIPAGNYRVRFTIGTTRMLFPNLLCSQADCSDRLAEATVLTIISNRTSLTGIDATFGASRLLRGRVVDRNSGAAVEAQLTLRTSSGARQYANTFNGDFVFENPPIGSVTLFAASATHIDAYFPNIDCQEPLQVNCNFDSFVAPANFTVPPSGDSSIEFKLLAGASISGSHLRSSGARHFQFEFFPALLSANGLNVPASQNNVPSNLSFVLKDLQPGNYLVGISENPLFFMPAARIVTLLPAQALTGIDFTILPKAGFEGRVTSPSGAGIAGVAIDFWNDSNLVLTAQTDENGWYWVREVGNAGAVKISTDAPLGFTNQIHQAVSCPLGPVYSGRCNLRQGLAVTVPAVSLGDHLINFQLNTASASDQIFYSDFEIGVFQRNITR